MGGEANSDPNILPSGVAHGGNDTAEIDPASHAGNHTTNIDNQIPANLPTMTTTELIESDMETTRNVMTSNSNVTTSVAKTTVRYATSDSMSSSTEKTPTPTTKVVEVPYIVVSESSLDDTTHNNVTKTGPHDVSPTKTTNTGAIIGVIMGLLIVGIIVIVIVILVKKKKISFPSKMQKVKRKKIVTKMENPHYHTTGGKDYRFSTDTPLHIGPTTNLTKFNNPNLAETPVPRVLQSESPTTNKRSSLPRSIASRRDKRKAPPPPNPFGGYDDDKIDLYEKASQGSGELEMETFTVRNENAADIENQHSHPLVNSSASTQSNDDEHGKDKNANHDIDDNVLSDPSESLLPKKDDSHTVDIETPPDDYDNTKNPFFGDNDS